MASFSDNPDPVGELYAHRSGNVEVIAPLPRLWRRDDEWLYKRPLPDGSAITTIVDLWDDDWRWIDGEQA